MFFSLLNMMDFQPSIVCDGLSWYHFHRFFWLIQLMKILNSLVPVSKSSFLQCFLTDSLLILYPKDLKKSWASKTVRKGPCRNFRRMIALVILLTTTGRLPRSQALMFFSSFLILLIVYLEILVTLKRSAAIRTKCIRNLRASLLQLLIFLSI